MPNRFLKQGAEGEPGMITLAISAVLSSCENTEDCSVEISFFEIYMDRCYDLLEPKAKEIIAMDDKDGRVRLKGLSWVSSRHQLGIFSTFFQLIDSFNFLSIR